MGLIEKLFRLRREGKIARDTVLRERCKSLMFMPGSSFCGFGSMFQCNRPAGHKGQHLYVSFKPAYRVEWE